MWLFIKGSFWFSLVLVLLPVFSGVSSQRLADAPPVEMSDAFAAASGAYDYLSNICAEKPDVCEKGSKTFTALGYRAKEGARVAFDYLNTKFVDNPTNQAAADQQAAPALAEAPALAPLGNEKSAEIAVESGVAAQPFPAKLDPNAPKPYRPPVTDKVVTGTVLKHIPIPLARPTQDFL